jgi:hypothetical protein
MNHMTQLVGCSVEKAVDLISDALKRDGFRILTRINLHERVKEKTGKVIHPIVVLGVLNPQRIFESIVFNSEISELYFRTLVIRDLLSQGISVEISQPVLVAEELENLSVSHPFTETDQVLQRSLARVGSDLAA